MDTKAKKIEIQNHGNYLYGKLDGVDLVESGELIGSDGKNVKYGSSIKLKFILSVEKEKTVMGEKLKVVMPVSQIVQIHLDDGKLLDEYKKFMTYIGKDLLLPYFNNDNFKFKIDDISKVIIVA
jgi:hypothetical protein